MTNINDNIKRIFECIDIYYDSEIIKFHKYEKIILDIILRINNNDERNILFIGIEKKLLSIITLISISFYTYIHNLVYSKNSVIDNLKIGDKVLKDNGEVLIFNGIENKGEQQYISLLGKKNCKSYLPLDKENHLSIYNGKSSRINNYKEVDNVKKFLKNIVSEALGIIDNDIKGIIKNYTLVVCEQKKQLEELLSSIKIGFNNEKYFLSEIFSFVYTSKNENEYFFSGNISKENPVIRFTSNSASALDLVRENENIDKIFYLGEKSYCNSIETDINLISYYNNIKKLVICDCWESNFDFSLIVNNDSKYSVYALTKEFIKEVFDKTYLSNIRETNKLQNENYVMLRNLLLKKVEILKVNNSAESDNIICDISNCLKQMFENCVEDINIINFIKIVYSICKNFESSLLKYDDQNQWSKKYREQMNIINNIIEKIYDHQIEKQQMKYIVNKLEELVEFYINKNQKFEKLYETVNSKKTSTVFVSKSCEKKIVELNLKKRNRRAQFEILNNFDVNNIYKCSEYNNLIITDYKYYKNKYSLLSNRYADVSILSYRREGYLIKKNIKKINGILSSINKKNKLVDKKYYEDIELEYIICDSDDEETFDLEALDKSERIFEDYSITKLYDICINQDKVLRKNSVGLAKVKCFVKFEDGCCAFLTNNYQCNIINDNDDDIEITSVSKIKKGNKMIFVSSKLNDEEDIVKLILRELLKNSEFNLQYGEYFKLNNLWKKSLLKYIQGNCLTVEDISNELLIYGSKVRGTSISNWISNKIIGPQNAEDLRNIIKIIDITELNERLEEIIYACRMVRSIQVKVRKIVAKQIISTYISKEWREKTDIEKIIDRCIKSIEDYVYIGEISSILVINEEMGISNVNRINYMGDVE